MQKTNGFIIKSAFILGFGAFLSKIIGAIYRIPLTNLLGSEGLGLYQMVFPIYTLLLDISGAGVPSALSKLIAGYQLEDRNEYAIKMLKNSLKIFGIIGFIGSILMSTLSLPLSILQGNKNAYLGYIFLSPSVFLVCIISCFRGYFQGLKNMSPTAISQIIEQVVKLFLGLFLVRLFLPNLSLGAGAALLAVTVSEIVAVIFLWIKYKISVKGIKVKSAFDKAFAKEILKISLPITLIGIAIPLMHVINSFLIVNILSKYSQNATSLYGLFSGASHTVIGLPISICYAFSVIAIPIVSDGKNKLESNKNGAIVLIYTLIISSICAIFIYFFAPLIVKILFGSFSEYEFLTTVKLIKITTINIVFLSLLQTINGVLIGNGKQNFPLIGLSVGIIVNFTLNVLLLNNPALNIYGSAISSIACNFSACLINLLLTFYLKVKNADKKFKYRQSTN